MLQHLRKQILIWIMVFFSAAVITINSAELVDLSGQKELLRNARMNLAYQEEPGETLGLSDHESLQLVREINGVDGNIHYSYRQCYMGYPVYNYYIIQSKDHQENIKGYYGIMVDKIEADIPAMRYAASTDNDILERMKLYYALKNGPAHVKQRTYSQEQCEQVIFIDANTKARLCYAVSFFTDIPGYARPGRPSYIVDVTTGEILMEYDSLTKATATGPGGNERTGKYEYGEDYPELVVTEKDNNYFLENDYVTTINLNHGIDGGEVFSFEPPRNTYKEVNGAYSPINDAHHFGTTTAQMFQEWFGMQPLKTKIILKVHYGQNYPTAFWSGDSASFGDGDGIETHPIISSDSVAHELGHGFTQQNSNLMYLKQSAAINEAFSDFMGQANEFYAHGSNDWYCGNDIYIEEGTAHRYMFDPPLDGVSIDHVRDYHDNIQSHHAAGVYNKAFYLLATTPGWDIKKAFTLFLHANQVYWQPFDIFKSAAQGVCAAAVDLGYEVDDVKNAFLEVGIDIDAPDLPPAPPLVIVATGLSTSSINLGWEPVLGTQIDAYAVYMSDSVDGEYTKIGDATTTGYVAMGLERLTTYYFKVQAMNRYGISELSAATYGTTLEAGDPPAAPQNLRLTLTQDKQVLLVWDPVEEAQGYILSLSMNNQAPWLDAMNAMEPFIMIPPEAMTQGLFARIASVNQFGPSMPSASLRLILPDPPQLTFTAKKYRIKLGKRAKLTWNTLNAVEVIASGDWEGNLDVSGDACTKRLYKNSEFTITAFNSVGEEVSQTIDIEVYIPEWRPYRYYNRRDFVIYDEKIYRCRYRHFALKSLNPARMPYLWILCK